MTFAEKLAAIAAEQGSQKAIADACGITEATISRYINGSRTPTLRCLLKMAGGLGMTLSELLEGVDG